MENRWTRLALISAAAGAGAVTAAALIVGAFLWYSSRPSKPRPWDVKAIVATFDYADTESGEPEGPEGFRPDNLVLCYTLENTTEMDYRMPSHEQLEVDGRLKREKSLSGAKLVALDNEQIFIPAKQRRRFAVHLNYPMKESVRPAPKTREESHIKWKRIADYIKKELLNLDGFVVFDTANRYQINLPNGWEDFSPQ